MTKTRTLITTAGAAIALTVAGTTSPVAGHGGYGGHTDELETVVADLNGPRGVDALGHGKTLITEADGTFSLVIERSHHSHGARHGTPKVIELGQIATGFAPAIAAGRHGTVWLLTGGDDPEAEEPDPNAAMLFKWRYGWDEPRAVADIAAYQEDDPDPYDLEDFPEDSNPFGLAALKDGSVLVADAAGNDLLHVSKGGDIETVARLKPRKVEIPEGMEGAGTKVKSEAVATSVTVGKDGYWYVGELRGFPATPGTSQIWRIEPGSTDAICNPKRPWGDCERYADGLTSIVDLAAGHDGIYALTLSKLSWLVAESTPPVPGAEIGGLFLVSEGDEGHHRYGSHGDDDGDDVTITELVPDQLVLPGGVDVAEDPYVVGPIFPDPVNLGGSLMKID